MNVHRVAVFSGAVRRTGLGDRDHAGTGFEEGKRDLRWRRLMRLGDVDEIRMAEQPAFVERRIGHDRDATLLTPGQKVEFDAAAREVVEHLVDRDVLSVRHRKQFLHVVDVEIRHAPGADLAGLFQRLEGGDGFGEWIAAAPVQEIEVDMVDTEMLQAAFAGGFGAVPAGIRRQHLADDEGLVAVPAHRFADDALRGAIAVHLRCVDQRHAEIEAKLQALHLIGSARRGVAHAPRALPEDRDLAAIGQRGCRDRVVHRALLAGVCVGRAVIRSDRQSSAKHRAFEPTPSGKAVSRCRRLISRKGR
ncbi:hypothetical protein D9M68_421680 [compost metagenome]